MDFLGNKHMLPQADQGDRLMWWEIQNNIYIQTPYNKFDGKFPSMKELGKLTFMGSYIARPNTEWHTRLTEIFASASQCGANIVKLGKSSPTQSAEFFKSEKLA